MPPSVLITGATGFLGGAVARRLHALGWQVTATGRNLNAGKSLQETGLSFHPCDLASETTAVRQLVAGNDSVVHCAALSSPWGKRRDFVAANILATQNVISACVAEKVRRLVHISSPSVSFDYATLHDQNEAAPWIEPPANHYIATKRIAELLVCQAMQDGLPAIVLRPKALIGPGDTTLLPRVLSVASRGTFPLFGPDCLLDLTAIDDACQAVCLALETEETGGTYHLTSGQPLSRKLVLETIFRACHLTVKWKPLPLRGALALGSTLEWCSRLLTLGNWEPPLTRYSVGALGYGQTLDISAARRDLNYMPNTNLLEILHACGRLWKEARAS